MRQIILKIFLVLMFLILVGGALHTPSLVFLETNLSNFNDSLKAWRFLLVIASFALMVIIILSLKKKSEIIKILKNPIVLSSLIFLSIFTIYLFFAENALQAMAGFIIETRFIVLFLVVFLFLRHLNDQYSNTLLKFLFHSTLIVLGFGVLQFFLPRDFLSILGYGDGTIQPYLLVDLNPDFVRHSSFLRGPNQLGVFSAMVFVVAFGFFAKHQKISLIVMIMSLLTLWSSHSRSGFLVLGFGVLTFLLIKFWHKINMKIAVTVILSGLLLLGGLYAFRENNFISSVVFHENTLNGRQENSNDQHLESLQYGISEVLNNPFGKGIGSSGSASLQGENPKIIESQYLSLAYQVGVLGLLSFLTLYLTVLFKLFKKKSMFSLAVFSAGIGLMVSNVFLPLWADGYLAYFWWALAAISLAKNDVE